MRVVFALVLVAGMALAAMAVFLAQNYMSQTEAALNAATEMQRKTGRLVLGYGVNNPLKVVTPLN